MTLQPLPVFSFLILSLETSACGTFVMLRFAEHCDRTQQGSKRDEIETEYRIRMPVFTRRERDGAEDQKRRTEVMEQASNNEQ